MRYRRLGRAGLDVGEIGLGTEYLKDVPRETTISVTREALDRGVNYMDMFYGDAETRDRFGDALEGRWGQVLFAGHLGAGVRDGKHSRIRGNDECEEYFHDLLRRLRTDHIGVCMLHWFDAEDDFDQHFDDMATVAQRLQREGKARLIGFSTHKVPIALKAIESGLIDVLMFPINLAGNAMPERKEFLATCARHDVALVAMKVYAGGKLLQETIDLQSVQSGWEGTEKTVSAPVTPPQCLSYALSQIAVCTTVPGPSSLTELDATFSYLTATDEQRDFSSVISAFEEYREGECVYCNHCLPCPADIDIGRTIRLLETAGPDPSPDLITAYESLPAPASACTECGDCTDRCPFGVDVIPKIHAAATLFEPIGGQT
jgi:hypothetical protein